MTNSIEIIGLIAGGFTSIALFPQVVKLWRSRSTKDISVMMYALFCCGLALWIAYGILISSLPVILSNVVTLVFGAAVLTMKLVWEREEQGSGVEGSWIEGCGVEGRGASEGEANE